MNADIFFDAYWDQWEIIGHVTCGRFWESFHEFYATPDRINLKPKPRKVDELLICYAEKRGYIVTTKLVRLGLFVKRLHRCKVFTKKS